MMLVDLSQLLVKAASWASSQPPARSQDISVNPLSGRHITPVVLKVVPFSPEWFPPAPLFPTGGAENMGRTRGPRFTNGCRFRV